MGVLNMNFTGRAIDMASALLKQIFQLRAWTFLEPLMNTIVQEYERFHHQGELILETDEGMRPIGRSSSVIIYIERRWIRDGRTSQKAEYAEPYLSSSPKLHIVDGCEPKLQYLEAMTKLCTIGMERFPMRALYLGTLPDNILIPSSFIPSSLIPLPVTSSLIPIFWLRYPHAGSLLLSECLPRGDFPCIQETMVLLLDSVTDDTEKFVNNTCKEVSMETDDACDSEETAWFRVSHLLRDLPMLPTMNTVLEEKLVIFRRRSEKEE